MSQAGGRRRPKLNISGWLFHLAYVERLSDPHSRPAALLDVIINTIKPELCKYLGVPADTSFPGSEVSFDAEQIVRVLASHVLMLCLAYEDTPDVDRAYANYAASLENNLQSLAVHQLHEDYMRVGKRNQAIAKNYRSLSPERARAFYKRHLADNHGNKRGVVNAAKEFFGLKDGRTFSQHIPELARKKKNTE